MKHISRRSLTLVAGTLSTYITNLRHIFYILFFSVCLVCKFFIFQKFLYVTVTFTLLLGAGQLREIIPSRAENVFTKILLRSKYDFDQENVSVHMG